MKLVKLSAANAGIKEVVMLRIVHYGVPGLQASTKTLVNFKGASAALQQKKTI